MSKTTVCWDCPTCGSILIGYQATRRDFDVSAALDNAVVNWGPDSPPVYWPCTECPDCGIIHPAPDAAAKEMIEQNTDIELP